MSVIEKALINLIQELKLMTVDDLDIYRDNMVQKLQEKHFPEFCIDFYGYIVDTVIVKKVDRGELT